MEMLTINIKCLFKYSVFFTCTLMHFFTLDLMTHINCCCCQPFLLTLMAAVCVVFFFLHERDLCQAIISVSY